MRWWAALDSSRSPSVGVWWLVALRFWRGHWGGRAAHQRLQPDGGDRGPRPARTLRGFDVGHLGRAPVLEQPHVRVVTPVPAVPSRPPPRRQHRRLMARDLPATALLLLLLLPLHARLPESPRWLLAADGSNESRSAVMMAAAGAGAGAAAAAAAATAATATATPCWATNGCGSQRRQWHG